MGFINFRGGKKADNFKELSEQAKRAEAAEQESLGSIRNRRVAADYFGFPEMAEKDNRAILASLLQQYRNLNDIHAILMKDNALGSVFDDKQLMVDLYISSISEILNQGKISDIQKVKALQLLESAFKIENRISAKDHFIFLQRNEKYRGYVDRCFSLSRMSLPQVWLWIQQLGNQPLSEHGQHNRNRMDTAVHFLREYVSFMLLLSFYISQIFPGQGCGKNTREILHNKLDAMSTEMTRQDRLELDISQLVNPILFNPDDFRTHNTGFEQTERQSQGLKGVLDDLKKKVGQKDRILQLIQLLDSCRESGSKSLENEYKKATKGL